MSASLEWAWEGSRLLLAGRIDENADLEALVGEIPASGATLDLAGLSRINSIGVREWMDFVSTVADRPLTLERCAPVFVDQLNAIANFAGGATVKSVLATYECEADGESQLLEAQTADVRDGRLPFSPRCPRCAAEMVPAQENELYYRFLRYGK